MACKMGEISKRLGSRALICFLVLLQLQLQPSFVTAHTTTVCAATAPSQCADKKLVFLLGTYHTLSGTIPGQVHILAPSGVKTVANFGAFCTASATATGTCPAPDIKSQCSTSIIPSDASVTCYKETNNIGYAVANSCDAFPVTSGSYSRNDANAYAVVSGATSGTYQLWTENTDDNFDPCSYDGWPCKLSSSNKYTFELMVAGCGAGCPSAPVINGTNGSLSSCANAFDGFICAVTCQTTWVKYGGALTCVNGNWQGDGGAEVSCGPTTTTTTTSTSTTSITITSSTSTTSSTATTTTSTTSTSSTSSTSTSTITTSTATSTTTSTSTATATSTTTSTSTITTTSATTTSTTTSTATTTSTTTSTATVTTSSITTSTSTTTTTTTTSSSTSTSSITTTASTTTTTTTTVTETLPAVFVEGKTLVEFSAPSSNCTPLVPSFETGFANGIYAEMAAMGLGPEDFVLNKEGTCAPKAKVRRMHELQHELAEESRERRQLLGRRTQAAQYEFDLTFTYKIAILKVNKDSLSQELQSDAAALSGGSGTIDAAAMALVLVKRLEPTNIMAAMKAELANSKDPLISQITVSSVKIEQPVVVGAPSQIEETSEDITWVIVVTVISGVCCVSGFSGFLFWMLRQKRHSAAGDKEQWI